MAKCNKKASYLDRFSHWLAACSPSCSCTRSYPLCSGTHDHTPRCWDGTHQCLWTENPNEEWIIQISHHSWKRENIKSAVVCFVLPLGHNWRKLRTRPQITSTVGTLWPIYALQSMLSENDLQLERLAPEKMRTLWRCQELRQHEFTKVV